MRRSARGSGIAVDPNRIHKARLAAGLSLRGVAGDEVSATFIHFVERGVSRPSRSVLALIARRTGKPIEYFMTVPVADAPARPDLADELIRVGSEIRNVEAGRGVSSVEREALKLLEMSVVQGAELIKSIERKSRRGSRRQ